MRKLTLARPSFVTARVNVTFSPSREGAWKSVSIAHCVNAAAFLHRDAGKGIFQPLCKEILDDGICHLEIAGIEHDPRRIAVVEFDLDCPLIGHGVPAVSVVRLGRQEIDIVTGRGFDHRRNVGHVVQLKEQILQPPGRRHPEQRPRRLVGFVEIAMRDAARHPHQIASLGGGPHTVELHLQLALPAPG